jgi:DNA-binding HxlR family transcriptional regulator
MSVATRSLTNPYAMRALRVLAGGPLRFNALERAIGIQNPPALSIILKKLARDDVVVRTVVSVGPPAVVRYHLTKFGLELAEKVKPLLDLLDEREPMIERSRAKARVEAEATRATELRTTA